MKKMSWTVIIFLLLLALVLLISENRKTEIPETKKRTITFYKCLYLHKRLYAYWTETGVFPAEKNWIKDLSDHSSSISVVPHSELKYSDFVDGWGNVLQYKTSDWNNESEFVLYSVGANGINENGAGDDLIASDAGFSSHLGGHAFSEQKATLLEARTRTKQRAP